MNDLPLEMNDLPLEMNDLPIGMNDLPIEMINLIIQKTDFMSWFNFCKTTKKYYGLFFETYKVIKVKDNYCVGKKYIILNDVQYYLDPNNNGEDYLNPMYNHKYIYCNECSNSIKITKLSKHMKKCTKTKQLLCEYCQAPKLFHPTQCRKYVCKLMMKHCIWCEKNINYPVYRHHKISCKHTTINCKHCNALIQRKNICRHNGDECPEHIYKCSICDKKYHPHKSDSRIEHNKQCYTNMFVLWG